MAEFELKRGEKYFRTWPSLTSLIGKGLTWAHAAKRDCLYESILLLYLFKLKR